MGEADASVMPPAFGRPGRILLRSALYAWSVVAAALILGIAFEAFAPPRLRPISRLFAHRENLHAPERVAAEQARALLPPCRRVVVDTDDPLFFYVLRYQSYPTWIVPVREDEPADAQGARSCRVYYHQRILRIEEARVE